MIHEKLAYKLLYADVNPQELTVKPHFVNTVLTFLNLNHMLNFIEDLISAVSSDISYIILWKEPGMFIVDIPDTEGKLFVYTDNEFIFDMFEDICRKFVSNVIIY